MRKTFSERGFEDYIYWQSHDKKILKKINDLPVVLVEKS